MARPVAYRAALTLDGLRVHCDTTSFTAMGSKTELIYSANQSKIWHVDHAAKEYLEIDERLATGVSDGVNKAIEVFGDLARKMRNEEPETGPAVVVRRSGRTATLAGLACSEYVLERGGVKTQEAWVASWTEAGVAPADLAGLKRLLSSYHKVLSVVGGVPMLSHVPNIPMDSVVQSDGFPVLFRHYHGSRILYEIQLNQPEATPRNDGLFRIPEGYHRTLL